MTAPLLLGSADAALPRSTGAPSGAAGGGVGAGLVSSHTSGTDNAPIEIDPILTRLRRMAKAVRTAARMHEYELLGKRFKPVMLTLTYREVGAWNKRHVSELLRHVRQWMKRRGHRLRYVWVAELQQRGALHYHVVLWLPRGLTLPKPDKQGWWTHGSTRIEWARKPAGYLAKYASKLDSKVGIGFPPGARLHGTGGLDEFGRSVASWFRLPQWAREVCDLAGRAMRIKGVGLVDRETGVCLPSPWRLSWSDAGTLRATRSWSYAYALRGVGGPFSWLPGSRRP
jgi:hypothetical protein